jgi:hypothetical protein
MFLCQIIQSSNLQIFKLLNPMDLSQINYLAVFVAALSSFVIGFLWYSPLTFGNVWMREAGLSEEKVKQANMIKIFGLSFLLPLVICFNLAAFLGPDAGLAWADGRRTRRPVSAYLAYCIFEGRSCCS